jgi:transcriptional regulator with XRE-family HTH domain
MSHDVKRARTADELLRLAVRRFARGDRLDIEELARDVGVSRATAYRWAGGNVEALTSRVIGALLEATFARALREADGRTGWDRILDAEERGLRYISTFEPYRRFVARHGEKALRIVASKEGHAHPTNVRLHQELLEAEARAGTIRLPVDAHTLAYALVRIAESFLYADIIAGEEPEIDRAIEVMRLLCRDPAGSAVRV